MPASPRPFSPLLDDARAGRWAAHVAAALSEPYPYRRGAAVHGPGDAGGPTEVHPAFHGAVWWHAAVHGLWSLTRIARRLPELEPDVRELLDGRLRPEAVAAEVSFLASHPAFERPYGWAWVLTLAGEVQHLDPDAGWARALAPLTDLVTGRLHAWWPTRRYPDRSGTRDNSALTLLLAHHRAVTAGDDALRERVVTTARGWFLHDVAAPARYEPSAGDLVSPVLTEAHLMARVLDRGDFERWYERFLPDTATVIPRPLREPPQPGVQDSDSEESRVGLVLSRAWSWRGIARALPSRDERRVAALDAADTHLAAGLETAVAESPRHGHRLVTFGLLALDGPSPASPATG